MLKIDIKLPLKFKSDDIVSEICKLLPVAREDIKEHRLLKLALELFDKKNIHYKASVGLCLSDELEAKLSLRKKAVQTVPQLNFTYESYDTSRISPVVIGAGPCGLFAALILAEAGAHPVVLERGLPVEERAKKAEAFISTRTLDTKCNVQFGEGGAGTYSDGKLKVGALNKYKQKVLDEFIEAGATPDIAYSATAHLGTDKLSDIVKGLREKIKKNGGRFIYGARFTDFVFRDDELCAVKYIKDREEHLFPCTDAVLAIGHSARDTIGKLYESGFQMIPKGFGVGMRIEHPREYINELIYGKNYDRSLETATYHLVTHLKNGRSVYSFCMCPGGTVVPAASEDGGIVTNGMSTFDRNADNSNCALLVSVTPSDFGSDHPLAGIEFQRNIENKAFSLAGGNYTAPSIQMHEMAENKAPCDSFGAVMPSYPLGTAPILPDSYFPEYITSSLKESFADFDAWLGGYYLGDAVLTGPETRTTAPIRILRDENTRQAILHKNIYPSGEGAGYAGGIVSSALDGVYSALAILEKIKQ